MCFFYSRMPQNEKNSYLKQQSSPDLSRTSINGRHFQSTMSFLGLITFRSGACTFSTTRRYSSHGPFFFLRWDFSFLFKHSPGEWQPLGERVGVGDESHNLIFTQTEREKLSSAVEETRPNVENDGSMMMVSPPKYRKWRTGGSTQIKMYINIH